MRILIASLAVFLAALFLWIALMIFIWGFFIGPGQSVNETHCHTAQTAGGRHIAWCYFPPVEPTQPWQAYIP